MGAAPREPTGYEVVRTCTAVRPKRGRSQLRPAASAPQIAI